MGAKARIKKQKEKDISFELGSVLAVDIVAFSVRPTTEQSRIASDLIARARACEVFQKHGSNGFLIANSTGDGFVAAFRNFPEAASHFAEELASSLKSGETGYEIRAAINIGPFSVLEDIAGKPNMVGDGVNLACRALECADPGEILVTGQARGILIQDDAFADKLVSLRSATVKHGVVIELYRLTQGSKEAAQIRNRGSFGPSIALVALAGLLQRQGIERFASMIHERACKRDAGKAASQNKIAVRLYKLRGSTIFGLCAVILGLLIELSIRGTAFDHDLKLFAYSRLISIVPKPESSDPVYIVDIGRDFDLPEGHTDTHRLSQLIDRVAQYHPSAIGVDVDFGALDSTEEFKAPNGERSAFPDYDGMLVENAWNWTHRPNGVPIYLAVSRNLFGSPAAWFPGNIDGKYSLLAVAPVVPATKGDQIVVTERLRLPQGIDIPSMASALSKSYRILQKQEWPPRLPGTQFISTTFSQELLKPLKDVAGDKASADLFMLNSQVVEALHHSRIAVTSPDELLPERARHLLPAQGLTGKIVIIGTTISDPGDTWFRPGMESAEPGVYLHGAAAYTLAKEPLFEFNTWTDLLLTIGLSLATLSIGIIWSLKLLPWQEEIDQARVTAWLTLGIVLVSVVAGLTFAGMFHIVWFGFLMTAALLAFHPKIEAYSHMLLHKINPRDSR